MNLARSTTNSFATIASSAEGAFSALTHKYASAVGGLGQDLDKLSSLYRSPDFRHFATIASSAERAFGGLTHKYENTAGNLGRELERLSSLYKSPDFGHLATIASSAERAFGGLTRDLARAGGVFNPSVEGAATLRTRPPHAYPVEPRLPGHAPATQANYAALDVMLEAITPGLTKIWTGALFSLTSANPDRGRHVAHSLRELFSHVLHSLAPDALVTRWASDPSRMHRGRPTRAARIAFIYSERHGADATVTQVQDFIDHLDELIGYSHALEHDLSDADLQRLVRVTATQLAALLRAALNTSKT
jgi:hypothetical protein